MVTENLAILFERDINRLKTEIGLYKNESALWTAAIGTSNSGGNLCLHLLGNLQHYIGAVLGNTSYKRNRPEEFSRRDVPLLEMDLELEGTLAIVTSTIRSLSAEQLARDYPEKVFEYNMTTEYFLLHLLAHLNYHLGQINYHRRMQPARPE